MAWKQIEATPTHLSYLIAAAFLTFYALFSVWIRSRLHLSEPPLALLTGIAFGPQGVGAFDPTKYPSHDIFMQEFTRVIAGIQVFVVGIELPKSYVRKHWVSLAFMLGPVMGVGWMVVAGLIVWIMRTNFITAIIISACLTPTDPVLAASILSNSLFSTRVPRRIKNLLQCESGLNDGMAFPFLYVGLSILTQSTAVGAISKLVLITILWQCALGTIIGIVFGLLANKALRFADTRRTIDPASFVVFYLVLALLSIGVASTLGLDDFLVAFAAGATFSADGWFAAQTRRSQLTNVLDLLVNSTFFIYFGAVLPWAAFSPGEHTPHVTPGRLLGLLALTLLLRRLPAMLALKRWIPDVRTWNEAVFAGHFGPMGVGALFLAIEARAQLETGGESIPLPRPDPRGPHAHTIALIWPVIAFVVLGSTLVHGVSVVLMSVVAHFMRRKEERADFMGAESDPLGGMEHDATDDSGEDESDGQFSVDWQERRGRVTLPA